MGNLIYVQTDTGHLWMAIVNMNDSGTAGIQNLHRNSFRQITRFMLCAVYTISHLRCLLRTSLLNLPLRSVLSRSSVCKHTSWLFTELCYS